MMYKELPFSGGWLDLLTGLHNQWQVNQNNHNKQNATHNYKAIISKPQNKLRCIPLLNGNSTNTTKNDEEPIHTNSYEMALQMEVKKRNE